LDFASPVRPLVHFPDIDLAQYLLRRADKAALRLIPESTRRLFSDRGAQSNELIDTVRAFADASLNVKQAARRLKVHTNTIYFRLNRVKEITSIDPRTYSGISLLMTAHHLLESRTADDWRHAMRADGAHR
jgi:DNA-binding PucR family transcriptional regulator